MTENRSSTFQKAVSAVRSQLGIVLGFSFFLNLLMLTVPLYMLQVYDRVLTAGSVPTLMALTLVAVGLVLMASVLEWVRSRLLVRLAALMEQGLEVPLLQQLLQSRNEQADRQRLADMERVSGFLSGAGVLALCDAPWLPVYLLVITALHPVLGLIATVGAVVLALVALVSDRTTRELLITASGLRTKASRFAERALDNAEVTRTLGMAGGLVKHWQEQRVQASESHFRASDQGGNYQAIGKFLRPVLQISMLGAGAVLVLNQQMTAGAMVAGSILLGRALAPLEMTIGQLRNIRLTRQAWRDLMEFFTTSEQPASSMPLPRPAGELTVEKLVAPVPGSERPVIKGIGFSLQAGESLAVVGHSASGKSTLARLLTGSWAPSSGAVRLDGADVSQWQREELGHWLGYLPQDVELFPGTVRDNIARFGDVDAEEVVRVARMADIHELILSLPDGYETLIETTSGFHLSGGQRQRVALARALYGNPSFIVLDEPDASLDRVGEQALVQVLQQLKENKTTVVVITHRPTLLRCVDKVLVLANGCIEHFGEARQTLTSVSDTRQEVAV
ncbi:type I secretion system permease/ATPase [Parendozoicomonas haliclonae]|uniref:Type I secretion system ATP-binding protein PrsD n=1 Tax=Parendozoicomonas haliclonae TaxID=1960125 RepID=A0A1X7AJU3_9GAMM|nr:type I secretion system permease/ATPase [Parendozoicomonas haliclonae]SMA47084.1 Type I secretion system ATP-binding protein PrsD [Parendozoicomonas haliclonae]